MHFPQFCRFMVELINPPLMQRVGFSQSFLGFKRSPQLVELRINKLFKTNLSEGFSLWKKYLFTTLTMKVSLKSHFMQNWRMVGLHGRVAKTCQPCQPVGANFSRPVLIFGQSTEKMLLAPVLQESSTDAGSRGASSTSSTRK